MHMLSEARAPVNVGQNLVIVQNLVRAPPSYDSWGARTYVRPYDQWYASTRITND